MAEKRKLPARERREPAAKRRISEGAPQTPSQPQSSSRKKASTPGNASNAASTPSVLPPEPPVDVTPLPTKIKDGEGLPTVATPQQAFTLSDKEYQSIAERYSDFLLGTGLYSWTWLTVFLSFAVRSF